MRRLRLIGIGLAGFAILIVDGAVAAQTPAQGRPPSTDIPTQVEQRAPRLKGGGLPVRAENAEALSGRVEISWDLNDEGGIKNAVIMESSGHPELDEATLAWGKGVTFEPPQYRYPHHPVWQPGGIRDYRAIVVWEAAKPPRLLMGHLP